MKEKKMRSVLILMILSVLPLQGFAKVDPSDFVEELPTKTTYETKDIGLGTFYTVVKDSIEPANYSMEFTVFVHCVDRKAIKKTLNPPKQITLDTQSSICRVERPVYNQRTKVLRIEYSKDSGTGDSLEEVCDIPISQEFHMGEACDKWNSDSQSDAIATKTQ